MPFYNSSACALDLMNMLMRPTMTNQSQHIVSALRCRDKNSVQWPFSYWWPLLKWKQGKIQLWHVFLAAHQVRTHLHLLYQQIQYIHTRTTFVTSCSWATHLTPLPSVTGSAEWARTVKIRVSQIDDHCGSRPLVEAVTCPTSLQLP